MFGLFDKWISNLAPSALNKLHKGLIVLLISIVLLYAYLVVTYVDYGSPTIESRYEWSDDISQYFEGEDTDLASESDYSDAPWGAKLMNDAFWLFWVIPAISTLPIYLYISIQIEVIQRRRKESMQNSLGNRMD